MSRAAGTGMPARAFLLVLCGCILGGWLWWSAPQARADTLADPLADTVRVSMRPTASAVILGEKLDLSVSVTNTGTTVSRPLIVHLDITKPDQATSVDPEDWTPTLSKPIGTLDAGQRTTVRWNIQPISPGTFAAYAVVLSPEARSVSASNVLEVQVQDRRSLNPGGILPVSVATPSAIGALLLGQQILTRRRGAWPAPWRPSSALRDDATTY